MRAAARSSASSAGSIAATRPGTYTEHERSAAPRSRWLPAATKCETSAMWTYARSPSPSRTTEIASSKSFAVSGSIVIVGRSRRSVRPSRLGGGGEGRLRSRRALPAREAALEHGTDVIGGSQDAFHTARPRPVRTTARSPGPVSRRPWRSMTSGTPGVKYGRRRRASRACAARRRPGRLWRTCHSFGTASLPTGLSFPYAELGRRRGEAPALGRGRIRRGGTGGASAPSPPRRAGGRPRGSRARSARKRAPGCPSCRSPSWATRGSTICFPMSNRTIAATDPMSPQSRPSIMNGPRTNQFVAPTSFMTSISRRLAKIDSRIVFAMSSVDAMRSTMSPTRNTASMMPPP